MSPFSNSATHLKTARWLALLISALGLLLAGCGQTQPSEPRSSLELPTQRPTVAPSPVSTRVLPVESLTPAPTATITPIPSEARALVVDVYDGETIGVVMDGDPMRLGYQVRLIGVDAPPNSTDNPWGVVSYETLRGLANLKIVRLVRDDTDFDDDGYLLRYVYLGDELLNSTLIARGLAEATVAGPNTQLEADLTAAEQEARAENLGIWSNQTPTPTPGRAAVTVTPGEPITATATLAASDTVTATAEIDETPETTGTPAADETPETTGTPAADETPAADTTITPAAADTTTATPTSTRTATPTSSPTAEADNGDLLGPNN